VQLTSFIEGDAGVAATIANVMVTRPPRRNVYAERLSEFPDIALGGDRVFSHRGKWREWFSAKIGPGFDGRVIFEIGCSDAAFLSRIAAKSPRTAFVGLDWKFKSVFLGAQRVAELALSNVALLRHRAQDISRIFADEEVDEIWVFHPDPCDRDVELKNRLIAEPFLLDAHRVLRPGASLCLKTDHPGYYQWVLGLFGASHPDWAAQRKVRRRDLMRDEDIPAANAEIRKRFSVSVNSADFWNDPAARSATVSRAFAGETTAFESRFMQKRLPIYYLEMTKS
jgi:tRNA G46 methylase TrmB